MIYLASLTIRRIFRGIVIERRDLRRFRGNSKLIIP